MLLKKNILILFCIAVVYVGTGWADGNSDNSWSVRRWQGSSAGTDADENTISCKVVYQAVVLSLKVAACCVVLNFAPAVVIGWLLSRRDFVGKASLDTFVKIPLVVPPVIVGYFSLLLFGPHGPLGRVLHSIFGLQITFTWLGAVLASAVVSLPLMVHSARQGFQAIDKELELAAQIFGAGHRQIFWHVTFPLALPGIIGGVMLGFARSLGEFGATITLAGNIPGKTQTIPLAVYSMIQTPGGESAAMYLACVSVGISMVSLIFANKIDKYLRNIMGLA